MEPKDWIIIGVLFGAGVFVMSDCKINWNWVIGIVIALLLGASFFIKKISPSFDDGTLTAIYSAVLASVALLQWRTYSLQAKIMNRQLYTNHYLEVYEKLSSGVAEVINNARYSDKARAELWQARDKARLVLNEEIVILTEDLLTKIRRLQVLYIKLFSEELKLPVGSERTAVAEENYQIVMEFSSLNLYEKFRGFIAEK